MCVIFDSVFFRVRPWQMLFLNSIAHASGSKRQLSSIILLIKQEWGAANLIATPHSNKRASCSVQQMIKLQA
jgi:hypothetical protein